MAETVLDPELRYVGVYLTEVEAAERCKELKPDIITLDLNLPGGGLEMMSKIKGTRCLTFVAAQH